MAREEYLPGNWFKRPEKLGERVKTKDVWKVIKRMNKNVISIAYSSSIIALKNYLPNYTKYHHPDRYLMATTIKTNNQLSQT